MVQGAREGDRDPYLEWHEATEELGWPGIGEGRRRQSKLDKRVLKIQR
jgi:hypothetical protein